MSLQFLKNRFPALAAERHANAVAGQLDGLPRLVGCKPQHGQTVLDALDAVQRRETLL